MVSTLVQARRCKMIVSLLLSACLLNACDEANTPTAKYDTRQNSGNGGDSVDLNNPLLKGEASPIPAKVAERRPLSSFFNKNTSIKSILLAACSEDKIVMGYGKDGELRRTGSDIDGYCEGYLMAAYQSMMLADAICRDDPEPPSAYFLRSVFQEHAKANGALTRGDAQAVADAFLNAFSCERPS